MASSADQVKPIGGHIIGHASQTRLYFRKGKASLSRCACDLAGDAGSEDGIYRCIPYTSVYRIPPIKWGFLHREHDERSERFIFLICLGCFQHFPYVSRYQTHVLPRFLPGRDSDLQSVRLVSWAAVFFKASAGVTTLLIKDRI